MREREVRANGVDVYVQKRGKKTSAIVFTALPKST